MCFLEIGPILTGIWSTPSTDRNTIAGHGSFSKEEIGAPREISASSIAGLCGVELVRENWPLHCAPLRAAARIPDLLRSRAACTLANYLLSCIWIITCSVESIEESLSILIDIASTSLR